MDKSEQDQEIGHVSYSQIYAYLQCGHKYYLKYHVGMPTLERNAAASTGTVMHKVIQDALTLGVPDDLGVEYIYQYQNLVDESPIPIETGENFEKQYLDGLRIARDPEFKILINQLDAVGPFEVEKKITWQNPGVDKPMLGYIDMIDKYGTAYDIKTSARKWPDGREHKSLQATMYLAGMRALGMVEPSEAYNFTYLVLVKTKRPQIYRLNTWRTDEQLDEVERMIAEIAPYLDLDPAIYKGIKRPLFDSGNAWVCNSCQFKRICLPPNPVPLM